MARAVVSFESPAERDAFDAQPRAQELIDAQVTSMLSIYAKEQRSALATKVVAALDSQDVDIKADAEALRMKIEQREGGAA